LRMWAPTARWRPRLARTLGLDWRTRHRAVRAKYAAIARLRPQPESAAGAFIEKPAGIRRHGFRLGDAAVRAGDDGFQDHDLSSAVMLGDMTSIDDILVDWTISLFAPNLLGTRFSLTCVTRSANKVVFIEKHVVPRPEHRAGFVVWFEPGRPPSLPGLTRQSIGLETHCSSPSSRFEIHLTMILPCIPAS
jgi:hypothetical protein